jgi:Secretion system C-terminal sorting domain
MKKQLLFVLLANVLMVSGLIGQNFWTGASSTSWTTAGNWTGGIPANNSVTNIIIPNVSGGSNRYPVLSTAINYKGNIEVQTGASLTIASGGSINWTPGVSTNFTVVGGGTITIQNGGSITLNSATKGDAVLTIDGTLNNAGTITNTNGDIFFQNASGMGATTLNCSGSGSVVNNSYIDGVGTYTGCRFTNPSGGKIGFPNQIDCITFGTGLTNNGTMEFDLKAGTACTDYDRIAVTGTMTFGGTFTAVNGGVNIGNALQVITYTSRSGTFTNSNVNLGGGKFANVSYGATALTLNIGSSALPVEFISFDANTEGGKNKLTWATASEIRSQEYAVERSEDGTKFYQIGTVKAKGSAANYSFIDATPKFGINYYRLKQVDTDGTFTYTKTEAVETGKGKKSIKIFPTTTEGVVSIENETLSNSNVSVFNAMGQLVYANKSTNSVDLSGMVAGLYFVEVQTSNGKVVEKVFKR